MKVLPQRCPVPFLYLNWLLYLGLALFFGLRREWLFLGVWVLAAPPLMYAYVRWFPRLSESLGYGSVADRPAERAAPGAATVVMYTGLGCPFCPIMERRLRELQPRMGFELKVIDVTRHPEIATRKRIGSVPTIEVAGRRQAGCVTSQELARLIAGAPAPEPAPAGGGV